MDQMHAVDPKDAKTFWKILDKMSSNKGRNAKTHENIRIDEWVNHFKNIFHSSQTKNFPTNPNHDGPLDYEITLGRNDEIVSNSKIWEGTRSG